MVVLLHRRATLPKPGRSCVRGRPRSPRSPPLSFKSAIMVRIHAAALLWAWAQISSGGNGASAGSDTRALLTLLCTHEHDASRTSLAHLLMPAIHQTSWKANSANYFAFRGFSKVRRGPILCLAPHCLDYAPGRALRRDYRDLAEPGRTQQLPVLLAGTLLPATEKHQHVEVHQGETRPLGRIRVVLRGEYLLDHPQPRARRHRPVAGG